MRSLRAAVGASAAALLLLAGCGDDPDPGDPSSTWTPTGTPESPTSAATQAPVEPALPQAATKATEAGARAFIEYYWELINYAQVTGDVKALKSVSASHCTGCQSGISGIRDLYRAGGHLEGGAYTIEVGQVKELKGSASLFAFEAKVKAHSTEQSVVSADGKVATNPAGTSTAVVAVLWTRNKWRLEGMQLR